MLKIYLSLFVLTLTLYVPSDYALSVILVTFAAVMYYGITWFIHLLNASGRLGIIESYSRILLVYICMIFASILLNSRMFIYQDYVEIVVMVRNIGVLYLFFLIGKNNLLFIKFSGAFAVFSVLYILVNVGQVYDSYAGSELSWLYSLYIPQHHLEATALLMERGEANRFTGLSGNPNAQGAIFCLLFVALSFMANRSIRGRGMIAACVMLIVLSQSRTALLALMVMLTTILGKRFTWANGGLKFVVLLMVTIPSLAWFVNFFNLSFVASLFKVNLLEQESLLVRLENWRHLLEMIWASPLIGNAPNQEFFFRENINADSEYILVTWRYGFLGLFAYGWMVFYPLSKVWRMPDRHQSIRRVLLSLFVVVTVISVTNVTLTDYRFSIIYVMIIGLVFGRIEAVRYSQKMRMTGATQPETAHGSLSALQGGH